MCSPAADSHFPTFVPVQSGGGDNYAHLETSTITGLTPAASLLTTPVLPAFPANGGILSFYYHMFGATTGSLSVSSCTASGACTVLWLVSGQQQNASNAPWLMRLVNLPSTTQTVQWSGTKGTSFTGDLAVDSIVIGQGNTLPPSTAPTPLRACPVLAAGAIFAVTSSIPERGCNGNGGPTNQYQGTCFTTTSGTCFTDGPGDHGNNERCTINVLQQSYLSTVGPMVLETCCDWLIVNGTNTRLQTSADINATRVTAGQQILWQSDASVTTDGFTVCVSDPTSPRVAASSLDVCISRRQTDHPPRALIGLNRTATDGGMQCS
jgi:hypothetical protein